MPADAFAMIFAIIALFRGLSPLPSAAVEQVKAAVNSSLPTRPFMLTADSHAASLLSDRLSRRDSSDRLAIHYKRQGFGTLALLFEANATLQEAEGKDFG